MALSRGEMILAVSAAGLAAWGAWRMWGTPSKAPTQTVQGPSQTPGTALYNGLPAPERNASNPPAPATALTAGTRPDIAARREAQAQAAFRVQGAQDNALAGAARSMAAVMAFEQSLATNSATYAATKAKAQEAARTAGQDAVAAATQAQAFVALADSQTARTISGLTPPRFGF